MRVGIIGFGGEGAACAQALAELQHEIVRVADPVAAHLADVAVDFPHAETGSTADLIAGTAGVDALVISGLSDVRGGSSYRSSLIRGALDAGCHVLVDAPLASSIDDARALASLAEERRRVLLTAHYPLYQRGFAALREWISKPNTGTLLSLRSQRAHPEVQSGAESIWREMSNDLALLCFLLDATPPRVDVQWRLRRGVPASGHVTLLGGPRVHVEAEITFGETQADNGGRIGGATRVEARTDRGRAWVETVRTNKSVLHLEGDADRAADEDLVRREVRFEDPLRALCLHFSECVETGESERSGGRFGADIVRLVDGARRAVPRLPADSRDPGPLGLPQSSPT